MRTKEGRRAHVLDHEVERHHVHVRLPLLWVVLEAVAQVARAREPDNADPAQQARLLVAAHCEGNGRGDAEDEDPDCDADTDVGAGSHCVVQAAGDDDAEQHGAGEAKREDAGTPAVQSAGRTGSGPKSHVPQNALCISSKSELCHIMELRDTCPVVVSRTHMMWAASNGDTET